MQARKTGRTVNQPQSVVRIRALGRRVTRYSEAELGRVVGVSRERIRQILLKFDLPYKPRNKFREQVAGYSVRDELAFNAAFRLCIDRLVALTDVRGPDECWPWKGSISADYGVLYNQDHWEYVHRIVYRSAHGPIPRGFDVVHSCEHRWCQNPRHMFAARRRRWVRLQMSQKFERGSVRCNLSDDLRQLTPAKVRAIRRAYARMPKWPQLRKGRLIKRVAHGETLKLARRFGFKSERRLQKLATGQIGGWILEGRAARKARQVQD
jgi:hypothetical protein